MDPLSIIGATLALANVAVQSFKAASALFGNLDGVPEQIRSISSDVKAFELLASSLAAILARDDFKNIMPSDVDMLQAIENLTEPLKNCKTQMMELTDRIKKWRKPTTGRGRNGVHRSCRTVAWALSTRSEIDEVRKSMEGAKTTLSCGLNIVLAYVFPLRTDLC